MKNEVKLLSADQARIKIAQDLPHIFEGYASIFGEVDSYGDTILPGAFEDTLKNRERPVKMRWNHFGPIIGRWTELAEDSIGLRVRGELTPRHTVASDVAASLAHGAFDGLSIGYWPIDYENDGDRRTLKKIELAEISVVEEPADLGARVTGIKKALEDANSLKEIEYLLRTEIGLSQKDATTLVSRVKALDCRDGSHTQGDPDYVAHLITSMTKRIAEHGHQKPTD